MTRSVASSLVSADLNVGYWLFVPLRVMKPARRNGKLVSPWLSMNDRNHWGRSKTLTKHYRRAAFDLAVDTLMSGMDAAHIVAWCAWGDNRRRDPANYMPMAKAMLDGLVDCLIVPDDSSRYVVGPDMRRDEALQVGVHIQIIELKPC